MRLTHGKRPKGRGMTLVGDKKRRSSGAKGMTGEPSVAEEKRPHEVQRQELKEKLRQLHEDQPFEIDSPTTDIALVEWPYAAHDHRSTRPVKYFDKPCQVDDDLWIAHLDDDLTADVLVASEPAGRNYHPYQACTGAYAFIRTNAPQPGPGQGDFDPDLRLRTCIALSRLVHPTSAGLDHAVRLKTWARPRDKWEMVPHTEEGVGEAAFVVDVNDDWLIPDDVPAIGDLLRAHPGPATPSRIAAALWYHEVAARTYYADLRWPLLVTALESLVRIKNEKRENGHRVPSSSVFCERLAQIGAMDPSLALNKQDLRSIYEQRSDLVHGFALATLPETTRDLYRKLDSLVRAILRKVLLDPAFGAIFSSDKDLQHHLPL